MFGIEKNRVNIIFSDKTGFSNKFIAAYMDLLENDLNILRIDDDDRDGVSKKRVVLQHNHKLNRLKKSHILEKFLEGKLFNIDIVIYNVSFYNKSHINYLISLGITIIIFMKNDGNYARFSTDFENTTYFLFKCSADNDERIMSRSSTFMSLEFKKNDYYLENYQTDSKYSLYNWIDVQIRNNKLKKI